MDAIEYSRLCMNALGYAIVNEHFRCAELLLDTGSKLFSRDDLFQYMYDQRMSYLEDHFQKIWENMEELVKKRNNVKNALYVFIGILRRRLTIRYAPTAPGDQVPKDIVFLLSCYVRKTRFDKRWNQNAKIDDNHL